MQYEPVINIANLWYITQTYRVEYEPTVHSTKHMRSTQHGSCILYPPVYGLYSVLCPYAVAKLFSASIVKFFSEFCNPQGPQHPPLAAQNPRALARQPPSFSTPYNPTLRCRNSPWARMASTRFHKPRLKRPGSCREARDLLHLGRQHLGTRGMMPR